MHCNNRTGLFAAMYRIVVQGWDKQAALEEMQRGGFGDEDDMRDASAYVRGADVDGLRLAMANGECSPSRFAVCHVREVDAPRRSTGRKHAQGRKAWSRHASLLASRRRGGPNRDETPASDAPTLPALQRRHQHPPARPCATGSALRRL